MYSAEDKAAAMQQLDADLAADDITPEQYSQEEARINAGSSRSQYLKDVKAAGRGLHARAFSGDSDAIAALTVRYGLVLVFVLVLGVAGCIAGEFMGAEMGGYDGDSD